MGMTFWHQSSSSTTGPHLHLVIMLHCHCFGNWVIQSMIGSIATSLHWLRPPGGNCASREGAFKIIPSVSSLKEAELNYSRVHHHRGDRSLIDVFSQHKCEGQRFFCLFNTNSAAKTHPHTLANMQAPSASSIFPQRGSTVRLTAARQSAKPDPALTSSRSRQGAKQEGSVAAQDPTLLILLSLKAGRIAYWRWLDTESQRLVFCQFGWESMLCTKMFRINHLLSNSQWRNLKTNFLRVFISFGVWCAFKRKWLPWEILLGVWMSIEHNNTFVTFLFRHFLVTSPHYCAQTRNILPWHIVCLQRSNSTVWRK